MNLQNLLETHIKKAVMSLYQVELPAVEFQTTRKEFEGDVTAVVFPMLRFVKGNPEQIGKAIGEYLVQNVSEVTAFNVVKGFLNLVISESYYHRFFQSILKDKEYGFVKNSTDQKAVMVEYASPNTNKPLHLGHIRNVLLGYSVAEILKASGKKVYKTQIINDRGIHICKSMLAWQKFGNGETPESSGLKGDKLVGNYYVMYSKKYKEELDKIDDVAEKAFETILEVERNKPKEYFQFQNLIQTNTAYNLNSNLLWAVGGVILADYFYRENKRGNNEGSILPDLLTIFSTLLMANSVDEKVTTSINTIGKIVKPTIEKYKNIPITEENKYKIKKELLEEYKKESPLIQEAQEMLRKWEAGDPETTQLWEMMNSWVYDGFEVTYKNIGVDFDSYYYESNTYLLGKDVVTEGLEKKVFIKENDGSVWIDLTDEGLDRKIVLRSDGTAVYMTQDIGTAIQRVKDYPDVGGMVYTVGNEQDYHFKVLFLILKKLGYSWAENLHHLSYGMVELPEGKMKSREGTVVDADDLIAAMVNTAKEISEELGKLDGYTDAEKENLYSTIGLGALKYFILKVDPKKGILFNPKESVDFQGNTGPFIQYTYARIQSILRKDKNSVYTLPDVIEMHPKEKELIKQLELFPEVIQNAATVYSPALVANYTYELVKSYNSFYQSVPILAEIEEDKRKFRVTLSKKVGEVIVSAFRLLGIQVPERM